MMPTLYALINHLTTAYLHKLVGKSWQKSEFAKCRDCDCQEYFKNFSSQYFK